MRLIMIFVLFGLMSCSSDTTIDAVLDRDALIGHWDVVSASRNGKATSTLADSYIRIDEDGQLYTNLMGSEQPHQIHWQDSLAISIDSSQTYKINSLIADSLDLSFTLQRHSFKLTFLRGELNIAE